MTFREAIAAIPYRSAQPNATGVLAPIVRATGHILYVTATLASSEQTPERYTLTDEEAHRELQAAAAHLTRVPTAAEQAPVSAACKALIISFCNAVAEANAEYDDWEPDDRGTNLKDLADRAAALASFLDYELLGLQQGASDPGRTL
jgi:hypothetical protein